MKTRRRRWSTVISSSHTIAFVILLPQFISHDWAFIPIDFAYPAILPCHSPPSPSPLSPSMPPTMTISPRSMDWNVVNMLPSTFPGFIFSDSRSFNRRPRHTRNPCCVGVGPVPKYKQYFVIPQLLFPILRFDLIWFGFMSRSIISSYFLFLLPKGNRSVAAPFPASRSCPFPAFVRGKVSKIRRKLNFRWNLLNDESLSSIPPIQPALVSRHVFMRLIVKLIVVRGEDLCDSELKDLYFIWKGKERKVLFFIFPESRCHPSARCHSTQWLFIFCPFPE